MSVRIESLDPEGGAIGVQLFNARHCHVGQVQRVEPGEHLDVSVGEGQRVVVMALDSASVAQRAPRPVGAVREG